MAFANTMEEFDLQPGEHVITKVRQHIFILVLSLLPFVLLALVPFIVNAFFGFITGNASPLPTGTNLEAQAQAFAPLGKFAAGVWWLFVWMAAFQVLTRYVLTVWVITNIRIVDIKQFGFFSRKVSSFLLLRVQDVTTDIHGILGTLIGFGKLHVDTAGHDEEFAMEGIAHPQRVRDTIMDQVAILQHTNELDASGI